MAQFEADSCHIILPEPAGMHFVQAGGGDNRPSGGKPVGKMAPTGGEPNGDVGASRSAPDDGTGGAVSKSDGDKAGKAEISEPALEESRSCSLTPPSVAPKSPRRSSLRLQRPRSLRPLLQVLPGKDVSSEKRRKFVTPLMQG